VKRAEWTDYLEWVDEIDADADRGTAWTLRRQFDLGGPCCCTPFT
jgi:hypothetical protein